jgi:nitroreductase/NAD-dependent dihydropyrimidine dehydrogenase PreA subunit
MIVHDPTRCTACGACVKVCVRRCLVREGPGVQLDPEASQGCLGCGQCLAVCPVGDVLRLTEHGDRALRPVGPRPDPEPVLELIRSRRSVRRYADAPPTRAQLETLLEASRYAPSGHNAQDVAYVVVRGRPRVRALGECALRFYGRMLLLLDSAVGRAALRLVAGRETYASLRSLAPRLRQHLEVFRRTGDLDLVWNAPCLVLVCGPDRPVSATNAVLAGANLMLQAHAMGLGTCALGLLEAALRRSRAEMSALGVEVPADHRIHLILAVGSPADGLVYRRLPARREPTVRWVESIA